METMYEGIDGSEVTTLTANFSNVDTNLNLTDASVLPDATNILVLYKTDDGNENGTITAWERCQYTAKVDNSLIVVRNGSIHASSDSNNPLNWTTGDFVFRPFTNWDHYIFKENIETLDSDLTSAESDISTNTANIATNTSDISNLDTSLNLHIDNSSNPHLVTSTQVGLGNVTNDAQLKREAGDINTFSEKATPVDADIILIEDSADSYNKKKVQISNLPSGGGSGKPAPLRFYQEGVVTQGIVGSLPKVCEAGTISKLIVLFGGLPSATFNSTNYIEFNVYKADMTIPQTSAPSWSEISTSSTKIDGSTNRDGTQYLLELAITSTTLTLGDLIQIKVVIGGTVASIGTDMQCMIPYDS